MFRASGRCAVLRGRGRHGGVHGVCAAAAPISVRGPTGAAGGGGGGRGGERSAVCSGEVCIRPPRRGCERGSGQRGARSVVLSSGASSLLSPPVPAVVGGSGQEEEAI